MARCLSRSNRHLGEDGFVLVAAMVFLVALTLVGILAINNSSFEKLVTGNERLQTDTFYKAESGIGGAIGLLGLNIEYRGFSQNERQVIGGIGFDATYYDTEDITFYMQPDKDQVDFFDNAFDPGNPIYNDPDDVTQVAKFFAEKALGGYRDGYWPRVRPNGTPGGGVPTTSLKIDERMQAHFEEGDQMNSNNGYNQNLPTTAARTYNIRSRHDNINNAASQISIEWKQRF